MNSTDASDVAQTICEAEWVLRFIEGVGPTVVAAAVVFVAWRQYKNDRWRLKVTNWERRYAIYARIDRIVGEALQAEGNIDYVETHLIENAETHLREAVSEAEWLFDEATFRFLEHDLQRALGELRDALFEVKNDVAASQKTRKNDAARALVGCRRRMRDLMKKPLRLDRV